MRIFHRSLRSLSIDSAPIIALTLDEYIITHTSSDSHRLVLENSIHRLGSGHRLGPDHRLGSGNDMYYLLKVYCSLEIDVTSEQLNSSSQTALQES